MRIKAETYFLTGKDTAMTHGYGERCSVPAREPGRPNGNTPPTMWCKVGGVLYPQSLEQAREGCGETYRYQGLRRLQGRETSV